MTANVEDRSGIIVAGPGSSFTLPGVIVSEIVESLSSLGTVTRLAIDTEHFSGLQRARSIASAIDSTRSNTVVHHCGPHNARHLTQLFRDVMRPDVRAAIAYVWPGLNVRWIQSFLNEAHAAGISTTILCASLPGARPTRVTQVASLLAGADRVYVGDRDHADQLATAFGRSGPVVKVSRALSLRGQSAQRGKRQFTTFLPVDDRESLSTVLSAFDAIPEARIHDYRLQVVMRYSDEVLAKMVRESYHADHVKLIGDQMTDDDLEQLCGASTALGVVDPAVDSRALATSISAGIATVVLASTRQSSAARGYVGGLMADLRQPASVNVAMNHAWRLRDLHFPSPAAWEQLARLLSPAHSTWPATLPLVSANTPL